MDTNFNTVIYQLEMLSLVNTAIKKLKAEHPDYEVFTMSLTTDFASGVSAVHFDSRASSERYLKKEAEQYQKYLQAGNLSMAEMYAPRQANGLSCGSVILLEQLRTIDKSRLRERVGALDTSEMKQIDWALGVSIGLAEGYR